MKKSRAEQILHIIQENPGIHVRGIIDASKLENGVVQHHLQKLEQQGRIKSNKKSRHRRYYSLDVEEYEYPVISNLRKKSKQKLLFAILSSGEPNFDDILAKLKNSPSTISWNISGLVKDGIIERVTEKGKTRYRVKNKEVLRKTLQKEFAKLFKDSFEHDEDVFLAL